MTDNKILSYDEILNRIGYFRNKKKISAYKLSRELGHSKTYFYKIENKSIQLTLDVLLDTLDILGVGTEEFFYDNLEEYKIDKEKLNITRNLTDDEIKSLKVLLNKR